MKPTIVIVGAGVAGLRAAQILAAHANVCVLESEPRVGGRVWSVRTRGRGIVELGAELVGARAASAMNLRTVAVGDDHWAQDGTLSPLRYSSVGTLAPPRRRDLVIRAEYAADRKDLDPKSLNHVDDTADVEDRRPVGGFDTLIQRMFDEASSHGATIRTGARVTSVVPRSKFVEVKWRDVGAHVTHMIAADAALVTVSIGVLQAKDYALLGAALNVAMKSELSRLKMGRVIKVALPARRSIAALLAKADGSPADGCVYVGDERASFRTWWTQGHGQYVIGWSAGSDANRVTGDARAHATRDLEQLTGEKTPRSVDPAEYAVDWSEKKESFLGAYSHVLRGKGNFDGSVLRRPIGERVFLAGEAIGFDDAKGEGDGWRGTVYGAWRSGGSAAFRILSRVGPGHA